jgi:3-oxoacyl-(acyl-carrier-protein) synthase
MKKRIVITGIGINTPLGDNLNDYYNGLIAGRSAITLMKGLDTSQIRCKIGGDLSQYDVAAKIEKMKGNIPEEVLKRAKKIIKTAPFSTKLTMLTAIDAFADAGLFNVDFDRDRMCALLGGHNLQDNYLFKNVKQYFDEPEYIDGLVGITGPDTDSIASIAETLQVRGPMYTIGAACASAGVALRNAINEINYGDCDLSIVGGGLADISAMGYQSLILVNAISYQSFNDQPERASRPFDTRREGFVPSHGTGMLVIEDLEHAAKRNARIYAEILAVETSNDGNHLSNPSTEGQSKLMKKVLAKAGLVPEQIDYINAHATATPIGDKIEIQSIKNVFGDHAYKLKINATKSITGHAGVACHVTELIAGILQMQHSCLHPSINIDELDPDIDLDVCANKRVDNYPIEHFLKNSFGFGGINCCSVIKKWRG